MVVGKGRQPVDNNDVEIDTLITMT
jgi:hypothetical protein